MSIHFSENIQAKPELDRDCAAFSADKLPQKLSETCLYEEISQFLISTQLTEFRLTYPLWTDGAGKTRWVYLPADSKIDTSDPNHWVFPKGTLFFKEFRKTVEKDLYSMKEIKVETRLLAKVTEGKGVDTWVKLAYAWDLQQQDAELSRGYENVLGTNHDIPTEKQCIQCHQGNVDMVLGFEALQLSEAPIADNINAIPPRQKKVWTLRTLQEAGRFTHPVAEQVVIPGPRVAKNALGYLHGNCGHCHNPLGEAYKQDVKHMNLRHDLSAATLENTPAYKTIVNQRTKNFTRVPYLIMGAQDDELAIYQSAIFIRMNSLLPKNRMPMLGTKEVDSVGVDHIHKWILSLPTPDDLDLETGSLAATEVSMKHFEGMIAAMVHKLKAWFIDPESSTHGLSGTFSFSHAKAIPKVVIIYLPEDEGLKAQPIMDHYDGDFTKSLVVGSPGEDIVLKNSDEVGHTIYAESNGERHWDIDYMPPNSSTVRKITWQTDQFVELKCKLHDYMKSWAGVIKTRYYKIIELQDDQQVISFDFKAFPAEFSQIKIWMPEYNPVTLVLKMGEEASVDLIRKNRVRGSLTLRR